MRFIVDTENPLFNLCFDLQAKVYTYVSTEPRQSGKLGRVSDGTSDLDAIFGRYESANDAERRYVANLERLFYTYARTGSLPPPDRDVAQGVYLIGKDIEIFREYANCAFWAEQGLVPGHARLH